MLPKKNRLPGYRILPVLETGKRFHSRNFNLIVSPKKNPQEETTLTIIVPKKIAKKAVLRNRTKRLFAEAIYSQLTNIPKGKEIVLMAKTAFEKEKLAEILPEVIKQFNNGTI